MNCLCQVERHAVSRGASGPGRHGSGGTRVLLLFTPGSRRAARVVPTRMAPKALEGYLNDHLGGAMLGSDLAQQIRDQNEGEPLGEVMERLAAEIEEDRETLVELMDALDVTRNPVKQVTGWVAEKASRVKFSGATSGSPNTGHSWRSRACASASPEAVPVARAARGSRRLSRASEPGPRSD